MTSNLSEIVVQVVDDRYIDARGVAALLSGNPRLDLLDPVGSVDALEKRLETNQVSVVICDLHLLRRSLSGPAAIRYIDHSLGIPVVAWSGASGFTAVANAIGAGALAFVSKDDDEFSLELWVEIIEAANRKEEYLTSTLARVLLKDAKLRPLPPERELPSTAREYLVRRWNQRDVPTDRSDGAVAQANAVAHLNRMVWRITRARCEAHGPLLTPRLREVGKLLLKGWSLKEAAKAFNIAESTLADQLNDLRKEVHDRARLGEDPGPVLMLERQDVLRFLTQIDAQENGWSLDIGEMLTEDSPLDYTLMSNRRRKAPRRKTRGL